MQISVVNYASLERTLRFDSEFYKPEFLDITGRLHRVSTKPLTSICKISDGNHISIAEYFQEDGVPYYRGLDINKSFFLESAQPVYIPEGIYERKYMQRSYFQPGDVLLSIVGTVGSISLVTEEIKRSTGSCKLAILRPLKISNGYLAVFLMGGYGNSQIIRNTRGAIQTGLLLEDMDQIEVFVPSKIFEEKISSIAKQAIITHRSSEILYLSAEKLLLSELNFSGGGKGHDLSFTKDLSIVKEVQRLDAEYFQPKYEEIVETVKEYRRGFDKLGNLVQIKKSIEPGSEMYREQGISFMRVSNLSKYGFSAGNQQFISEELYSSLSNYQPKEDEILLSKDGTPGIAYYLNTDPGKMILSGGILRVKINSPKLLPEYLTLVLNSLIVQKQIERDAGGSIIVHWRPDQIKSTVIPILEEDKQKEIQDLVQKSFASRELANSLLNVAKQAVEMAIEKDEETAGTWLDGQLKELEVTI